MPHPGHPRVADLVVVGARGHPPHERPEGVGSEDHSLLRVVQGKTMVEQLGTLLPPVTGPVGAGGAEAVKAGEDVEGVGGGHVVLLHRGGTYGWRPGTAARLIG